MAKARINLQDFGPVSTFSTSILSGLLIGLVIQNFFDTNPASNNICTNWNL